LPIFFCLNLAHLLMSFFLSNFMLLYYLEDI
jgi:hypothetical protein